MVAPAFAVEKNVPSGSSPGACRIDMQTRPSVKTAKRNGGLKSFFHCKLIHFIGSAAYCWDGTFHR